MKHQDFQSFERGWQLAPLYAVVSGDDFERKRGVTLLKKKLLPDEKQRDICIKTFSGESASAEDIVEGLETSSLFAEKEVVILYQADKLKKEGIEVLYRYSLNPNPNNHLVVVAETLSPASRFYKKIVEVGGVLHVPIAKAWQKEKISAEAVQRQVSEAKKSIDGAVCQALVQRVGAAGTRVESEVDKLLCYIGERGVITMDDVAAVSSCGNTATVWQLGEAVFRRDAKAALALVASIVEEDGGIIGLLSQLRKQVQTQYQVCSIIASGAGPDAVTQAFAYMRGRILQQNIQQANGYGLARFKKALILIDETALKARNSQTDSKLLIEILLTKLAA